VLSSGDPSCGLGPRLELAGEEFMIGRWIWRAWRAGEAF
jgi:hypothetical protein